MDALPLVAAPPTQHVLHGIPRRTVHFNRQSLDKQCSVISYNSQPLYLSGNVVKYTISLQLTTHNRPVDPICSAISVYMTYAWSLIDVLLNTARNKGDELSIKGQFAIDSHCKIPPFNKVRH